MAEQGKGLQLLLLRVPLARLEGSGVSGIEEKSVLEGMLFISICIVH